MRYKGKDEIRVKEGMKVPEMFVFVFDLKTAMINEPLATFFVFRGHAGHNWGPGRPRMSTYHYYVMNINNIRLKKKK